MKQATVDRCFKPSDKDIVPSQLHHFADASKDGYEAVTYLRIKKNPEKVKCSYVTGKACLAQIKLDTIPRMELSAVFTAVELNKTGQAELSLPADE